MRSKLAWTNNELEDLLRQLDVALEASGIGILAAPLRVQTGLVGTNSCNGCMASKRANTMLVWLDSVHPEDCPLASAIFADAIANKSDYASQFRIIRPNGETRHVRSRAKYFVDGKGEECFIGAEWDVTEDVLRNEQLAHEREAAVQSRAEAKICRRARSSHGPDQPSRLRRSIHQTRHRCPSILRLFRHIDIDRFKEINDRFGHAGGDAILRHVGSILSSVVTGDEIAARLGGDDRYPLATCDVATGRSITSVGSAGTF